MLNQIFQSNLKYTEQSGKVERKATLKNGLCIYKTVEINQAFETTNQNSRDVPSGSEVYAHFIL